MSFSFRYIKLTLNCFRLNPSWIAKALVEARERARRRPLPLLMKVNTLTLPSPIHRLKIVSLFPSPADFCLVHFRSARNGYNSRFGCARCWIASAVCPQNWHRYRSIKWHWLFLCEEGYWSKWHYDYQEGLQGLLVCFTSFFLCLCCLNYKS